MIRFHNLPSDERATDQMVRELKTFGYKGEDAQRIADEASSITIGLLRQMDGMIDKATTDEADRAVIQQLVLHQLIGISRKAMEMNAMSMLIQMLKKGL